MSTGWVGSEPLAVYAGTVSAVAAPYVTVRLTDNPDVEGFPSDVVATGTATIGDKVSVLIQPTGRAILIRS